MGPSRSLQRSQGHSWKYSIRPDGSRLNLSSRASGLHPAVIVRRADYVGPEFIYSFPDH